jgi:gliding motility-associated-like protein
MNHLKIYILLTLSLLITSICSSQSIEFLNQNSYLNIGDIDISGNSMTIEAKFKLEQFTQGTNIVSKHTSPQNNNYLLRPGSFEFTTYNAGNSGSTQFLFVTNPYAIELNRWYHIAGVYNGTTAIIYINGCKVVEVPFSGNLYQNNLNTAIGNQSNCICEPFVGEIDEVRIWNIARSENEIKSNMNFLLNTNENGLIAYYKLNNDIQNSSSNGPNSGNIIGQSQFNLESPDIDIFSISNLALTPPSCPNFNNGSIFIESNNTNSLFSIDNSGFSEINQFNNLSNNNYLISLISEEGCIVDTTIIFNEIETVISTNISESICQGESVFGYNSTGIYIDTLVGINLCDSIRILDLMVFESYLTNETIFICSGDTIDGLFEEGIYNQYFTTIHGCDSIVNKNVIISGPDSSYIQINICQGESFEGYNSSGNYIDTLTNLYNCDSIRILSLNVIPISISEVNIQICEGGTYEGYTFQGTYIDTLTNFNGCDSIRVLILEVSDNYLFKDTAYICIGEKFVYQNEILTNQGQYEFKYNTIKGCDSLYILSLIEINPDILIAPNTICEDSTYVLKSPYPNTVWFDGSISLSKEIFESGVYTCRVTSESGCEVRDTVIIKFRPTIYLPTAFTPNNDKVNDSFAPKHLKDDSHNIEMRIFSRSGEMIIEHKGPDPEWDGYLNQNLCQDGVYVVHLKSSFLGCIDEFIIEKITLISHD